ncbi:MAG: 50S ribosomal protein L30 [Synergistetes bacterium ADurb.Bin155]|jgi:large subunit ribosomal protein L30|nr:50S ribosomal protein L30 [Synergistales bacterium]NMD18344.1 50S ribosomal protein L30 [Synergistaceae bacterium]OQB45198.1 MAG: 50S ribosomal protein L30 [Synergistetes bacterium ADurb.Bin155]MBP8995680.1 50S ribosomal protein L30 [Synergistales bacterium]HOC82569.1 50S ribosomal protein L30 [Synergistales bacterium]
MAKLKVTLRKSTIGRPPRQGETVRALGLRKIRQTVIHEDTPQVRGMIAAVEHLVDWEIVEE